MSIGGTVSDAHAKVVVSGLRDRTKKNRHGKVTRENEKGKVAVEAWEVGIRQAKEEEKGIG